MLTSRRPSKKGIALGTGHGPELLDRLLECGAGSASASVFRDHLPAPSDARRAEGTQSGSGRLMPVHDSMTREIEDGPHGPGIGTFFDLDRTIIAEIRRYYVETLEERGS
jgi:hypothetical protein